MADLEWLETFVRRAASEAVGAQQFKGTLVCTGYKPEGHLVKGVVVPHGVESGWIPLGAIHAGNGFGILVGPKVGDPEKLDGDQFNVEFDAGDPNTLIATHKIHSTKDVPPTVQSGEMLLMHEGKAKVLFDKDKNLVVGGSQDNQQVMLNQDGSVLCQDKDMGQIYINRGNVYLGSKNATAAVETTAGPATKVFAA